MGFLILVIQPWASLKKNLKNILKEPLLYVSVLVWRTLLRRFCIWVSLCLGVSVTPSFFEFAYSSWQELPQGSASQKRGLLLFCFVSRWVTVENKIGTRVGTTSTAQRNCVFPSRHCISLLLIILSPRAQYPAPDLPRNEASACPLWICLLKERTRR